MRLSKATTIISPLRCLTRCWRFYAGICVAGISVLAFSVLAFSVQTFSVPAPKVPARRCQHRECQHWDASTALSLQNPNEAKNELIYIYIYIYIYACIYVYSFIKRTRAPEPLDPGPSGPCWARWTPGALWDPKNKRSTVVAIKRHPNPPNIIWTSSNTIWNYQNRFESVDFPRNVSGRFRRHSVRTKCHQNQSNTSVRLNSSRPKCRSHALSGSFLGWAANGVRTVGGKCYCSILPS